MDFFFFLKILSLFYFEILDLKLETDDKFD